MGRAHARNRLFTPESSNTYFKGKQCIMDWPHSPQLVWNAGIMYTVVPAQLTFQGHTDNARKGRNGICAEPGETADRCTFTQMRPIGAEPKPLDGASSFKLWHHCRARCFHIPIPNAMYPSLSMCLWINCAWCLTASILRCQLAFRIQNQAPS